MSSIVMNEVVLSSSCLTKVFGSGKKSVRAVDGVSFSFHKGEIISIVGESGSGKTTLMMMLMGLVSPTEGEILYMGKPMRYDNKRAMRNYWMNVQAIFQDPFSSFNQFFRVRKVFHDCMRLKGGRLTEQQKHEAFVRACSFVNLKYEEIENKYPFELSGGQMQRLMIARVFLIEPKVLIADEPTSMIDACSRSMILEMLAKLRNQNDMTIIFITHDLGLAYYISDTLYIMQHGRFEEVGPAERIIDQPGSAYTKRLINDVPKLQEQWLIEEDQ